MSFPTTVDLYNRIKHDPTLNSHNVIITYHDTKRNKYIDVDFNKWIPIGVGGDIPFHRVYYFKYKDIIIWNRNDRYCDLTPITKQGKSLPIDFSILTYNVLNDIHLDTKHKTRNTEIIEYLKSVDANIFCLQEVSHTFLDMLRESFENYNIV